VTNHRKPLKPGWELVTFGDVVRLCTDRCADPGSAGIERYVGLEHLEPNDLRIRSWGLVADGVTFTNRFEPGQVLFGKRRAYQRKVAVAAFAGVCSGDIYVFEPADGRLTSGFLPFICQSEGFFQHALATSAGSLSPRTNWKSLATFALHLPPPQEQVQLTRALHCLSEVSDSVRQAMLQRHVVVNALMTSACRSAPKATVESLLTEGPTNGVSPPTTSEGRGRPTLAVGAVYSGVVDTSTNLKYAVLNDETYRRFTLVQGDVLCVRGNGNRQLVGRAGIVDTNDAGCFYPDLLIRLRFNSTRMLPEFAAAVWNLPSVHASLLSRAKSTNGIYKINGADIRQHELPVPPLDEQRSIVAAIDTMRGSSRYLSLRQIAAASVAEHLLSGAFQ